jgi:hypothetical protein
LEPYPNEPSAAISTYYLPGREDPNISNISDYIKCFGTIQSSASTYKISVFVQEPSFGVNSSSGLINGVGHVAIGLAKDNITQIVGFYPAGALFSQLTNQNVLGQLKDNGSGNFNYTVSATYTVTPANFTNVINSLNTFNGSNYSYNLFSQNCTNFVSDLCQQGGITLPQSNASGPTEKSPGQLGQDLRNQKSQTGNNNINTTGGKAPTSKGPC